jgi:hypothetical protein
MQFKQLTLEGLKSFDLGMYHHRYVISFKNLYAEKLQEAINKRNGNYKVITQTDFDLMTCASENDEIYHKSDLDSYEGNVTFDRLFFFVEPKGRQIRLDFGVSNEPYFNFTHFQVGTDESIKEFYTVIPAEDHFSEVALTAAVEWLLDGAMPLTLKTSSGEYHLTDF